MPKPTKSSQNFKIGLPSLKQLLDSRVHFGHQKRRWFPGMAPFIFDTQKNVHIIDLNQTLKRLEEACQFLSQTASEGGKIIFVGTKRQAVNIVKEAAKDCGAMYITERWYGGFLTNFKQIKKNMKRLNDLEEKRDAGEFEKYTKKEQLLIDREIAKLERMIGGVRDLEKLPDALFVIDIKREKTAVKEAQEMGVPVVALIDTNSDPEGVDYPIPGNDDSAKSIRIIVDTVANAVRVGSGRKAKVAVRRSEVRDQKSEGGIGDLDLSNRARNALEEAGIKTIAELKKLSEEEIGKIKGLGSKSVAEIREAIKQ